MKSQTCRNTMLTEQDYIFDGFCHRPYDEKLDGWRNTQIGFDEFPILDMAQQIIEMGREINRLRRLVWEHEQGHHTKWRF